VLGAGADDLLVEVSDATTHCLKDRLAVKGTLKSGKSLDLSELGLLLQTLLFSFFIFDLLWSLLGLFTSGSRGVLFSFLGGRRLTFALGVCGSGISLTLLLLLANLLLKLLVSASLGEATSVLDFLSLWCHDLLVARIGQVAELGIEFHRDKGRFTCFHRLNEGVDCQTRHEALGRDDFDSVVLARLVS